MSLSLAGCSGYLLGDRQPQAVLTPEGGSATTVRDSAIASDIRQRIAADSLTQAFDIGVEVTGGRATLRGAVGSYEARDRAASIARSVNGVSDVDSRIVVNTNL